MFIIDFDDTLFDTQSFKHARMEKLLDLGVSVDDYTDSYREARNDDEGNAVYSSDRHAELLEARGYKYEDVLDAFLEVDERMADFVCPDAEDFLDNLYDYDVPKVLLSMGAPKFQELKVTRSGVDKHFDLIRFIPKNKADVVKELLEGYDEKVVFINDKIKETIEVVEKNSGVTPISKICNKFPARDYVESGILHFSTLTQIGEEIKRIMS